jgi:UDP-N-acetylmuramate--alanine ligase
MVYQPHRYTRTRDLFKDFCQVLANPDVLVLLDVYSAGENFIEGADGASLSKAIGDVAGKSPIFVEEHHKLADILQNELRDGDVLLMQGAGNIGMLASHLATSGLKESVPMKASA